ncbi:MAG TPA: metallophosphoesterase [Verrucomicrobiales bacterium]|jgi:Icc-related predicted phosphoesterase|nr:metallophosphoesterase [Verrucomicrobiales bacterium]
MQIVAISDEDYTICRMEGTRPDVLIALGDILDATIERAINFYRPRITFGVRGNHDTSAPFGAGVIDLHCKTQQFENLTFGGFEGCWRYKPRGHHLYEQEEVSSLMKDFPSVDVFVAHNSPAGIHERDTETHQGFKHFRNYIDWHHPRWFIHGHQHVSAVTEHGTTTVIGVYGEQVLTL